MDGSNCFVSIYPFSRNSWTHGRFKGLSTWKRGGIGGCLLSPTLVLDLAQ